MVNSLSNQRKEVAEKLRNGANSETLPLILNVAFAAFTNDGYSAITVTAPQAARRLAALIDPTCNDFGGEEGTNGEGYDFACSACGWCGDVCEPNYCPNCGARVVNINDAD